MPVDRIESIESFAIRLPRDAESVRGTAGSPTKLVPGRFGYRWSEPNSTLYSVNFEAALVKVTLASGLVGWGEPQAPLVPEVACLIADRLLQPALEGQEFDGSPGRVRACRHRMYSAMRVRGQTGGFMLDAIAGVDIALWDLAGKIRSLPVAELLSRGRAKETVPCYLSGLPGRDNLERVARAREAWSAGFRTFKLFHDRTEEELFDLLRSLAEVLGPDARLAVDALWRLDGETAVAFGRRLDDLGALWLECPLPPESAAAHDDLARQIRTAIALGESYRTRLEMAPFLTRGCVRWLQPDLGRWGITEAFGLAREALPGLRIVPHISIAMGPQIAAALHFAAACPIVEMAEYNPNVFTVANQYLRRPLALEGAAYVLPSRPGLGIDIDESVLASAVGTGGEPSVRE